jgi:DNA-directed RNA polymerase specialized sigma24 family protein
MRENDQTPAGVEHAETSETGPAEPDTADVRPQAADPAGRRDGFAVSDVAHWARLMPATNVWNKLAATTRLFDQISASTRILEQVRASTRIVDQIRDSTRAFDQVAAGTRAFDQVAASTRRFDQVGASVRVFEQAVQDATVSKLFVASAWKPVPVVSPLASRTAAAYRALEKLRIGTAIPDWFGAAMPDWKAWSTAASIGAWRIPGWTVPAAFTMPCAANDLVTFALPGPWWRSGLYDFLRRIREQLAETDEYLIGLFFAALDARDAVLTDPNPAEAVRRFARTWLRIRRVTRYVVDAVVEVLLSDDWHELDMTGDELREHLRARTRERHAMHRPIFERQLAGHPIGSLSVQIDTGVGLLALDQAVAGTHDTEREALHQQWVDPRIAALLDKLAPEQRHVVDVIAHDGLGWYEAADVAGVTPQEVEATRRRIRYLIAEQNRRAAARQR